MALSNERHQIKTFPTPLPIDLIFYEVVDSAYERVQDWEYGQAHWDNKRYPNHILVFVAPQPPSKDAPNRQFWYYAASREHQDLYNFEFRPFSIAGFRLDSVVRTYLNPREDFDNLAPASASTMPDLPAGMFTGERILFEIEQKRTGDKELDSLFVEEKHIYLQRYTNKEYTYDDFFGAPLYETQYICHKDEDVFDFLSNPDDLTDITIEALFDAPDNAAWGLQENGKFRGGARLNDDWYLLFERDTVPPWMVDDGRSYSTTVDFSWPAVLGAVVFQAWPLRAGGQEIYPQLNLIRESYRGPTRATVLQQFFATSAAGEAELGLHEILNPTPLQFSCPFFSLSVGPTLHIEGNINVSTGTENPKYAYAGATWHFPATNHTDWPDSMIASDELKPFRGGFLREQVTVYKPQFLEPPPP
jgi:hypothetical protein